MNRGIEIASDVADGPQSVIRAQVSNGVAVRMAVLEAVAAGWPLERRAAQAAPRHAAHRGTILLEEARVLSHSHFDGDQHVLRLQSPRCAERATPGASCTCVVPPSCRCAGRCRSCERSHRMAGSTCSIK